MQNTDWPVLLLGGSVVFGGMALIGLGNIGRMLYFRCYGRRVMAKVARINRHEGTEGDTFTIDVEYKVGEHRFTVSTSVSMSPLLYRVGERIPVYYFVERPEKGKIVTLRESVVWLLCVVLGLGIITFLGIQAAKS